MPCPFLRRKGHCLKGFNCDFSHNTSPLQHLRFYQQHLSSPFHKRTPYPYQILPLAMKYPICHPPMIYSYTAPNRDPHKITQTLPVPLQQLLPLLYHKSLSNNPNMSLPRYANPTLINTTHDTTHNTILVVKIPVRRNIPTLISSRNKRVNSKRDHVKFNCIEINTHQERKYPLPSLFVSNVCHITNKVTELSAVISINKPTVNLIVESWLTDDIPNSAINIGGNYSIFRLDRPTPGGGILAYIHMSVPVSRLSNLEEAGKR